MPKSRIPSPARSQGPAVTPRRYKPRRSRSVCSPAPSTTSGRLTSVIDQFKENNLESFTFSPLTSRRSVLTDKTDIEEPRRKSWWKNLNENSRDVMEVLDDNKITDADKAIEELFEIEVLRQDNKNYTTDLPDSSDNESVKSVVLVQRKLFTQNDNLRQKNVFGGLVVDRETLNKFHATNITHHDETVNVGTKNLFQGTHRPKTAFSAALLDISSPHVTTVGFTKANIAVENKIAIRNLFSNRPNSKRKNIFAEFIASESEHEISDIQPKEFYFKKAREGQRIHSFSKDKEHFLTSSINNEIEPDDWNNLPSSTMVENQLDEIVEGHTPVKRVRLSKLLEIKESEAETTSNTAMKTKELNNSITSHNETVTSQSKCILTEKDYITATANENDDLSNLAINKTKRVIESSSSKHTLRTSCAQDQTTSKDQVKISKLLLTNEAKSISSNEENEDDFTLEYEPDNAILDEKQNQSTSNKQQYNANKIEGNNTITEEDRSKMQNENGFLDKLTVKSGMNKSLIESVHNESLSLDKVNKSTKKNEDAVENILPKPHKLINPVESTNHNFDGETRGTGTMRNEIPGENEGLKFGPIELDNVKGTESCERREVLNSSLASHNATIKVSQNDDKYQEVVISLNSSKNAAEKVAQNEDEDSRREDDNDIESQEDEVAEDNVSRDDISDMNQTHTNQKQESKVSVRDETNKSLEERNEKPEGENSKEDGAQINQIQETMEELEAIEHEEDKDTESEEHTDGSEGMENDDETNKTESTENEPNESQSIENDSESEEQNENEYFDDDRTSAAAEVSDQNQEEMEVDNNEQSNDIEISVTHNEELVEKSPQLNHGSTDSSSKKVKSPEIILHDKIHHQDSFTTDAPGMNSRKTKSIHNDLNIRPMLESARNSLGANHTDSSAEGSGWDSHRTTRRTLRQTFGRDFTLRKSLRALVLEKSAKLTENIETLHSETVKLPQANSTAYPENFNREDNDDNATIVSDHEVSRKVRQTTLETYLQKIKQQNLEKRFQMEESIRNSLKASTAMETLNLFKVPSKPAPRKIKPTTNKSKKQIKSAILFDELPSEVIEDMKYKPPKRFQPSNASWITKRLYKFLEMKLEPKYDYRARVRAEKLVETIYHFTKELRRHDIASAHSVDVLKHELARLDVVKTHFEFYEFFHDFMPREVRVKVVPDIVNKISLPRHGVFSDILRGNTVQG